MLVPLCLVVILRSHCRISLEVVEIVAHQTLVSLVLCICRVEISNIRFLLRWLVRLLSPKHVAAWACETVLLIFETTSNELGHRLRHWVSPFVTSSLYFMILVELPFLNRIIKEWSLLSHLSVLWTCQVKATQIQLLMRTRLSVLNASSLLVKSYKLIYEVICVVACFALLHR